MSNVQPLTGRLAFERLMINALSSSEINPGIDRHIV